MMMRLITAGMLMMVTDGCGSPSAPASTAADDVAVRAAAAQFYSALNTLFTGDVAPMLDVWSHADDVNYMGPTGGIKHGWAEVLADWEAQAAMVLGGMVEAQDMSVIVGEDVAVTHNWEKGENLGADGTVETVSIRATNVFRKEGGAWKMIGHHTDLLPYLSN